MMILVTVGLALSLTLCILGVWSLRRHRTPEPLREDWWPEFERQFRAYAAHANRRGPTPPRRSADGEPHPGRPSKRR